MWYVSFVPYIDNDNLYANRILKILFEDITLSDYMTIRKNMILQIIDIYFFKFKFTLNVILYLYKTNRRLFKM